MSLWTVAGRLAVTAGGVLIGCETCPCEDVPACSPNDHSVLTDLYNTGVNGSHVPLATGDCTTPATDSHYLLDDDSDAFVVDGFNEESDCVNISYTCASEDVSAGSHTFRTSFTLPGYIDPNTFALLGEWGGDDNGLDILVNGVSTKNSATDTFGLRSFLLARGFQAGTNEITFVWNQGEGGEQYFYMRAKFTCIYTALANTDGFDWDNIH